MRKGIVLLLAFFFSGVMLSGSASAVDLSGTWKMNYIFRLDPNNPGQSTEGAINIWIITTQASGDFVGLASDNNGNYTSVVSGRIVHATPPYTQDLITFDRYEAIQTNLPYRAIYTGFLKSDTNIQNGHLVDTYGDSGTFYMTKQ